MDAPRGRPAAGDPAPRAEDRGRRRFGVPAYPSLAELPERPDVVDAFRRTDQLPQVAEQAVAAGARVLWIQLGLHSDEAVRIAYEAGLEVLTNRCVKIEHARFHGGLHLAGFDTGVISARRASIL